MYDSVCRVGWVCVCRVGWVCVCVGWGGDPRNQDMICGTLRRTQPFYLLQVVLQNWPEQDSRLSFISKTKKGEGGTQALLTDLPFYTKTPFLVFCDGLRQLVSCLVHPNQLFGSL